MYIDTSTEQKTKNSKKAVSIKLTAFLKPHRQHFVLPPPLINKRRLIWLLYFGVFQGFYRQSEALRLVTVKPFFHIILCKITGNYGVTVRDAVNSCHYLPDNIYRFIPTNLQGGRIHQSPLKVQYSNSRASCSSFPLQRKCVGKRSVATV
mgnify:CR=1 FL=1